MKQLAFALALLTTAVATPAMADDFSFTGVFADDNDTQFFDFTATGLSNVTLRSYSYGGGTNAAGTVISAGGFDPILAVYDRMTGNRIAFQDDSTATTPDPVTGRFYDVNFSQVLAAGDYRVYLSEYANFGAATLAGGFPYTSPTQTQSFCDPGVVAPFCDFSGAKRTGNWAFDVLGVETAVAGGIPEPATWGMMIMGFGMIGGVLRRRNAAKLSFA